MGMDDDALIYASLIIRIMCEKSGRARRGKIQYSKHDKK